MTDLVYVGFITGPFGLKGELKISSDSNHLDKMLKAGNELFIDGQRYILKKYHLHKGHLITLEGYEDINLINDLLKKEVYIARDSINLKENEFLYVDLLGCKIVDENEIGIVEDILYNKNNIFIKSGNLIIPIIDKYFEKFDTKEKIIYVKNSKELMLWELIY